MLKQERNQKHSIIISQHERKLRAVLGQLKLPLTHTKQKPGGWGGATSVIINPRNTTKANVSEESNDISEREEATDMRESKKKRLTTNFNKNKNVVRETGESDSPPIKIKKQLERQEKITYQQRTNCLYVVALTWMDKLTDLSTPPKVQWSVFPVIIMILNLKRVRRMAQSKILLKALEEWVKKLSQQEIN